MKKERTKVEFPIWRKKVDSSLFQYKAITIPGWTCNTWSLETTFPGNMGKRDSGSKIEIQFNERTFDGHITCTTPKRTSAKVYRLWVSDDLRYELSEVFLMSFMRDIENRLRKNKNSDVETEIPFWEFLDIEFDSGSKKVFMTAHYTQVPTFPKLFQSLVYSPALKRIDDETNEKRTSRIHSQDWQPRDQLYKEIGAENVIYMLMDTEAKLFYIGQAKNLQGRLRNGHPSIKDWDFYRYDVLPKALSEFRVALERMIIRAFATILDNKPGIATKKISSYRLANDKIDK